MDPELLQKFEELYRIWCDDILAFAEIMGTTPWSQQSEFLVAFQDLVINGDYDGARKMITKSAQGTGKTRGMAICGLWFFFRHRDALVVITAPTDRQCKSIYFSEVRRVLKQGPWFFREMVEVSATKLHMKGNVDWRIESCTAGDAEKAAGWHAEHMAILVEEVSGMDDSVLEAFIGTASGPRDVLCAIGNPTKSEGALYKAFMGGPKARAAWRYQLTLSKLQLAKEVPALASMGTIRSLIDEHGWDSDFVRVRIRGEFPNSAGDVILPAERLLIAQQVPIHVAIKDCPDPTLRRIGVDFARKGGDECAIFMRQGNAIVDWWSAHCEPIEAVEKSFEMQERWNWSDDSVLFVPDAVGMGQGMIEIYRRNNKHYIEFGSNYGSPDPRYDDLQTYAWYRAREVLKYQTASIPVDDDPDGLFMQLSTRISSIADRSGKIRAESKKEYRKRLSADSPDRGDAFIQCFAADDELAGIAGDCLTSFSDNAWD